MQADRGHAHRATAETIGTAFLLAAIVGSGIMASRLAPSDTALELLINSLATGAALTALVAALSPLSGAHLNPLVTLALASRRWFPWREVPIYLLAQFAGALAGVAIANLMFGLPVLSVASRDRSGLGQWLAESVATFGLVLVILASVRFRSSLTAVAVGGYIAAAYWFTSSTSFANSAVTVGRAFSDTFAGIAPAAVPPFLLAQAVGAGIGVLASCWMMPTREKPP